ncbi:Uncharacterised protein [Mycobacteroides abscessus subsp. bolletii]|uniref:DUF3558 domain-containing protein n=1 Tax=Mycobacteroides abscessus TaxID=36809 RepID=UPI0009A76FDA|nr:DUF3558 domain-containing protein [Mycobacteroides abscessus]SKV07821.1 Uncharacterised protein [Mycobacteroides abscessus subsp. bolletii]
MKQLSTLAAAGLLLVVSGCTHGDGPIRKLNAVTAGSVAYRDRLPQNVKETLARFDELRAVDPCGLVDDADVSALGEIDYFGVDGSGPGTCDISFVHPRDKKGVYSITLGKRVIDEKATQGAVAHSDSCDYRAETGYVYPGGVKELVTVSVQQGPDVAKAEASALCPVAEKLASAMQAKLKSPPLYADSKYLPADKLVEVDPCGPLEVLGDSPVDVVNMSTPFECTIRDRGDSNPNNQRYIKLDYTQLRDVPQPKLIGPDVNATYGGVLSYIDGVQVRTRTGTDKSPECAFFIFAGNDAPIKGSHVGTDLRQYVSTIFVRTPPHGRDCAEGQRVTEQLIRQYRNSR